MKIYLDDVRPCPKGWELAETAWYAIDLLKTEDVTHISLDHDLGPESAGTGYDVLKWIEEEVFTAGYEPPRMTVHSANPVGRRRMEQAIQSILRGHELQEQEF